MSACSEEKGLFGADETTVLREQTPPALDDVACFEIKVLEEWLIRHKWIEQGKGHREFLVPAIDLNNFPQRRLPEWRSMPWAR